jgi:hypothetical protein
MKARDAIPGLIGEIRKHQKVLARMADFLGGFRKKHSGWRSMRREAGIPEW